MGLDQFAYRIPKGKTLDEYKKKQESYPSLQYWRKHPNLQGWMENLWRERGGEGDFNCEPVELFESDIDDLELAVIGGALPETTGFFYGQSLPEDMALDLEFIEKAREALLQGDKVYYDSWW